MRMSQDLPVVVQVIDIEGRITALAEVFSAMVGDGLITIEDVEVVAYRADGERRGTEDGAATAHLNAERRGAVVSVEPRERRTYRAVAQFGSALDWGSRGRRFKSCQPDQV